MGPNILTTGLHTGKSNCNFEQLISLFGYFLMFANTNFQKLNDGESLSKAGVDKDPVISSFLVEPDFRPYFEISEY